MTIAWGMEMGQIQVLGLDEGAPREQAVCSEIQGLFLAEDVAWV